VAILSSRNILALYTALIGFLIYSPIIVLVAFSFKQGAGISFPYEAVTLQWYAEFLNDSSMVSALFRALELAVGTTIITTILCIMTALALRRQFAGRDQMFYILLLGIIIPGVIYGIGADLMYHQAGIVLTLWTALPVQVVWCLPWGIILMLVRFDPELLTLEQAAASLGAGPLRVLREVTFPLISPQIMSAALFAFTLSFGELARSLFTVGGPPTLPMLIYSIVQNKPATPKHFAYGTTVTVASLLLLMLMGILLTRGPKRKVF